MTIDKDVQKINRQTSNAKPTKNCGLKATSLAAYRSSTKHGTYKRGESKFQDL
jgi:hypothetical protein